MYDKKVIILNQLNDCYSKKNKTICSMVKLICDQKELCVNVFVNNVDASKLGTWFLVMQNGEDVFVNALTSFQNCTFTVLANRIHPSVSCVLAVKFENVVLPIASNGNSSCLVNVDEYVLKYFNQKDHSIPIDLVVSEPSSEYEEFVSTTENFYQNEKAIDIEKLKRESANKYDVVKDYSDAFEKYYASQTSNNYYNVVKNEIANLFVTFPPFYPLIEKFSNSFFVRIDFPKSERYFSMGILLENEEPKYICYALPGDRGDFCDKDFVYIEGKPVGFWILYQDAHTGQITVNKRDSANAK